MDIIDKLQILSDAAKYDVSCSSSGVKRKNSPGGLGNSQVSGICHSFSADGRCISLLKILLTNYCIYDCAYCINRMSNDVPRAAFTPEEVIDLTISFYKRNYIEGLFLSSGVVTNPNHTMELLIKVAKVLRTQHNFNGYIHLKAIPGSDEALLKEAGLYADRMSVNIELPSSAGLKLLAPQKNKDSILKPMAIIQSEISKNTYDIKLYKKTPIFVPGGQSTQLIVGATKDSDLNILNLSESLYKKFSLKRVYYSAYVPVNNNTNLPSIKNPPLIREHRLYQADWLLRFYGFNAAELLNDTNPNFDERFDPKTSWAINNLDRFPVEINRVPYETLLRIPGIGVRSAKRIIAARRVGFLNFDNLKALGIVLKRAQYFITCKGKYHGESDLNKLNKETLEFKLSPINKNSKSFNCNMDVDQLSFFSLLPIIFNKNEMFSKIYGEF